LQLNRVVVASCTPLTHEPLFQDAIHQAGLNPHLFEMAEYPQPVLLGAFVALGRPLALGVDLLVLSMPVVPAPQTHALAALFKAPLDAEGFLLEAHVKLRPVDSATAGVFFSGSAHYPKLLDETLIQAQAAAARAGRILSQEAFAAGGRVAVVDPQKCTGCLTCVRVCPFQVPRMAPNQEGVGGIFGAAHIEAAVCQGCGSCAAECPARAIELRHYHVEQAVSLRAGLSAANTAPTPPPIWLAACACSTRPRSRSCNCPAPASWTCCWSCRPLRRRRRRDGGGLTARRLPLPGR
jgi:heterodisulfide reductase subunit A-like polyferredoxin